MSEQHYSLKDFAESTGLDVPDYVKEEANSDKAPVSHLSGCLTKNSSCYLYTPILFLIILSGCTSMGAGMSALEVKQWVHDNCHKGAWPRHYPVPEEGHRDAHYILVPEAKIAHRAYCGEGAAACAYTRPGRSISKVYLPAENPLFHACHEQAHVNGTLRCHPHDKNGFRVAGQDCGWHYTVKPEDLEPLWRIR